MPKSEKPIVIEDTHVFEEKDLGFENPFQTILQMEPYHLDVRLRKNFYENARRAVE